MVIRVLPCDKDKLIYNFFDIFEFVQNDVIKNTQQNQDIVLIEVHLRGKKKCKYAWLVGHIFINFEKRRNKILHN